MKKWKRSDNLNNNGKEIIWDIVPQDSLLRRSCEGIVSQQQCINDIGL